ncbi:hypothetical protein KIPB_008822 [Kipferlia bialata]|uniref:Uncharacterized protein n=1 Tax=Kipferlia bialata TaxID=797122 RepID=A0A9K3GLM5_9EUKA|nr:hypothetical protein KIPB_008822 [Kipferlia bialata]|eukprot:g8822.t1
MLSSALFAIEAALRFFMMYVSLSLQHEYWQAPRSTHMYYGPYMIAALGCAVLSVCFLFVAVLGGITQFYPVMDIEHTLQHKRDRWFNNHGINELDLNAPVVLNAVEGQRPVPGDEERQERLVESIRIQNQSDRHVPKGTAALHLGVAVASIPRVVNTYSSSESSSDISRGEGEERERGREGERVVDVEGVGVVVEEPSLGETRHVRGVSRGMGGSLHSSIANIVEEEEEEEEGERETEREDPNVEAEGREHVARDTAAPPILRSRSPSPRRSRSPPPIDREARRARILALQESLHFDDDMNERLGPVLAATLRRRVELRVAEVDREMERGGRERERERGEDSSSSSRSHSPLPRSRSPSPVYGGDGIPSRGARFLAMVREREAEEERERAREAEEEVDRVCDREDNPSPSASATPSLRSRSPSPVRERDADVAVLRRRADLMQSRSPSPVRRSRSHTPSLRSRSPSPLPTTDLLVQRLNDLSGILQRAIDDAGGDEPHVDRDRLDVLETALRDMADGMQSRSPSPLRSRSHSPPHGNRGGDMERERERERETGHVVAVAVEDVRRVRMSEVYTLLEEEVRAAVQGCDQTKDVTTAHLMAAMDASTTDERVRELQRLGEARGVVYRVTDYTPPREGNAGREREESTSTQEEGTVTETEAEAEMQLFGGGSTSDSDYTGTDSDSSSF